MATLNTLRTRFGVVLSAIIAFALLAFIFSLKSEMGFSGSEPIVAKINGHNVTYTEYQTEYNTIQQLSGADASNEQQVNMLYAQTWQALFSKFAVIPQLNEMGLTVENSERTAIIRGEVATQTMYGAFGNPSTGMYDVASVNNFLLSSQGNPEAERIWRVLNEQAVSERETTKYAGLVAAGINVNSLEVAKGVEAANKSFNGRWAMCRYSTIKDSLVSVSDAEIKKYYDEHKSSYKQLPSRSVSYVEFAIRPSSEDLAKLESEATSVTAEFEAAEDIRAFIRSNRNGSISENLLSAGQLPAAEVGLLTTGKTYGPTSDGSVWRSSRVLKSVVASDTLSVRHIVLSYTDRDLADSLLVALRKGGNFEEAAASYSLYTESAQNGGDIGKLPFSAFTDEFAQKLSTAKKGDIVEIESGDMIQLIQVYDAGARVKHYQVAAIEIPIVPSDATRRAAHNSAGLFAVAANNAKSADSFKSAATESKAVARTTSLNSATRIIGSISGSQEVARWAHRAEVGDISEIFKVDNGYVVAMLTAIDKSEYRALSDVENTIKRQLQIDKKFEMIKSGLTGKSLDEQAAAWGENSSVDEFEDVSFGSTYVGGIGVEPRMIGAITSTTATGVMSQPVKGNSALFLFEVTQINESDEPLTAEDEKIRAEAAAASVVQQMLFGAIESLSEIEDLRGQAL